MAEPNTQQFRFGTTRWSMVVGAGAEDGDRSRQSLECLCRQYWNPVYAYLRRFRNLNAVDAEDLTQEFFAYVLERRVLPRATPELAKFRSFVKGVLRHFLSTEYRRRHRRKRGGGEQPRSLTPECDLPSEDPTPGEIFDRAWARQLLEHSLDELAQRLRREGRQQDLEIFATYTRSEGDAEPTYSDLAKRYGISDWEVWKRLSVVREELRSTMRLKVAETVRHPEEIDEELEHLRRLLP